MTKIYRIKGVDFLFSDEDVRLAARKIESGPKEKVRYYSKVENKLFPIRKLFIEMLKLKGATMPDIISHQAIHVIRDLGFEIVEI